MTSFVWIRGLSAEFTNNYTLSLLPPFLADNLLLLTVKTFIMRKIKFFLMATPLLLLVGLAACKKQGSQLEEQQPKLIARASDINDPILDDIDVSKDVGTFFAKRGPQAQWFKFNTKDLPVLIKTDKGTAITIPPDAFTVNGQPANGEVMFAVKEFTERGDVVMGGINTMGEAGMLITDGSFNLDATVDGVKVDDKLAKPLDINVPVGNAGAANTGLFEGAPQDDPAADAPFIWNRPAGNNPPDAAAGGGTFNFNWNNMGWLNCDRYWNLNPRTTITVNLTNNPGTLANYMGSNGGNTYVLFVPKGINSIAHVYTHTNNTQVVSYPNSIPVGVTAKLVAFSNVNGSWYYKEDEVTVTPNMVSSLTLNPSTEATVLANLTALSSY